MWTLQSTEQGSGPVVQDLGGAQEGFSLAESEMDQACRFMLVREPRVVVDPIDAGARVAQEGATLPHLLLQSAQGPAGPECCHS